MTKLSQSDSRLRQVPLSIKAADMFVRHHHRHSRPTGGRARWAIGVERNSQLVGVAIVGNPKARLLDDGLRLEVLRVCTHGTEDEVRNACSFLYARCKRISDAFAYPKPPITYIRRDESGVSLRAAGWCPVAEVEAQTWDRPSRKRFDQIEIVPRQRWEAPAR